MIASLFLAIEMALELCVYIFFTKQFYQPIDTSLRFLCAAAVYGFRNRTIKTTSQTHQPGRMCRQLVRSNHALAWFCVCRHTHFHQRDQATQVLITLSIFYENRYGPGALHTDLGADVRLDPILLCREVKPRCSVN